MAKQEAKDPKARGEALLQRIQAAGVPLDLGKDVRAFRAAIERDELSAKRSDPRTLKRLFGAAPGRAGK